LENTRVGPFLIIKRLGKNRRQQIFHARQTEQDKDVALKFIHRPKNIAIEQALDKVQSEANRLKDLRHKNLARTFGAGAHQDKIFFASELIHGESLASVLTRRGRLATDLVVEYGRQIAEILRYIHEVKLIDARVNRANRRRWDAPKRPQPEVAAYLAPEQFAEGPSLRADFYSLGVILFEMMSGQLPIQPDNLGRMIRNKQDAPAPSVAERVMDCPV
jgi:serine/threonine-protein kinase